LRIIKNVKAISKLALILLLLMAGTVGAILSYMLVMGYYFSIGFRVPDKTSIAVTNAIFPAQNATIFNVTIINPSFSPSNATVTQIEVITEENNVYVTNILRPLTPYSVKPGSLENFTCSWDWSDYTNREVRIAVFLAEGSGATFRTRTPPMRLTIAGAYFNATVSTAYFNLTVQNHWSSATYVNVTRITLTAETVQDIIPYSGSLLPHTLYTNASVTFICPWDWTNYRSKSVTIAVYTLQGYRAYYTQVTPPRVILTITEALFNATDMTRFNVTVQSSELSSIDVNIINITVTTEDGTIHNITYTTPPLPNVLSPTSSVTFTCTWNWTDYQGQNVTITVCTLEGYIATYNKTSIGSISLNLNATPQKFNFVL